MSNSTPNPPPTPELAVIDRTVRRALTKELPPELRAIRRRVLAETMSNGVPVRPSALCAVLAAHADLADSPLTFTADHVQELLWSGVSEFCEDVGLVVPNGCSQALYAVLAVAKAHGLFDEQSDSTAAVFAAFGELALA